MQIHQIKTRYSNTYLIEEKHGVFVVDVAKHCDGFVLHHIQNNLHIGVNRIDLVICTHDDPDHIGGVISLARSCHAASAIPYASKRPRLKLSNNPMGPVVKAVTAFGEAFRARTRNMYLNKERNQRYQYVHNHHLDQTASQRFILPKSRLNDGARLSGFADWEVVHTPGHSWDSVCFFHHPSRSLISGDTLLGSATKGYLVHPAIYDNHTDKYHTLNLLKRLNPQTVYPGHGSIFTGDQILDHL
ncbi:MAG: MBL fold metallo-hydrolase [Pseudomonadales bacterium]|nr:MBL fold metallo-hydrolase [Pseudomonadales bacterium]